jgi:hypothetical protein
MVFCANAKVASRQAGPLRHETCCKTAVEEIFTMPWWHEKALMAEITAQTVNEAKVGLFGTRR